jgi:ferredoxin
MLVIHPEECIDCGVCVPECPAEAIFADTEPAMESWVAINAQYAKSWPNITRRKDPPADADDWLKVENKFENYFSPKPEKDNPNY